MACFKPLPKRKYPLANILEPIQSNNKALQRRLLADHERFVIIEYRGVTLSPLMVLLHLYPTWRCDGHY